MKGIVSGFFKGHLVDQRVKRLCVGIAIANYLLVSFNCRNEPKQIAAVYNYVQPDYDLVGIRETTDTLTYLLNDDTYTSIKSFNTFIDDNNTEYISFFDQHSGSINIYNFESRQMVKRILAESIFKGQRLYKTTVFVKNFDSIFITNNANLYLVNGSGKIVKAIEFLGEKEFVFANFTNINPAVFKDGKLYAGVRPYVDESSLKELRKWKTLYAFDIKNKKADLCYKLPDTYQNNIYGYHFLDYSYCYNDRGNFVFSFPADPFLYETNLLDHNVSYYGKSRLQESDIQPVSKQILKEDEEAGFKAYLMSDSYKAIFFDPFAKRYLRVAKSAMSEAEYEAKNKIKKQRIIVFNENYKIIGESPIQDDVLLGAVFFDRNGDIYARINARDEYALHFVRLAYTEGRASKVQLANK